VAGDIERLKELRERTGAGMLDCKRALMESNGDIDAAIQKLRQWGLAAQAKRETKAATQGRIGYYPGNDGHDATRGAIVELNCETDFVARLDVFVGLVTKLAEHMAKSGDRDADFTPEAVRAIFPVEIEDLAASTGERLVIGQGIRLVADAARHEHIGGYLHANGNIGVLVRLRCQSAKGVQHPATATLAHDLALQIAAASPAAPEFIARDNVTEEVRERELEVYRARAREEKKPDNLIDKIAQGGLGKYLSTICLLEQPFIREADITVKQLIERVGKEVGEPIAVQRFVRYRVGEAKSISAQSTR